MKKFLSILLVSLLLLGTLTLFGCGKAEELKLGLGVYTYYEKITSADDDVKGKAQTVATAAAVLVDADGKIVDCVLDCADNTLEFTSNGNAIAKSDMKTKGEQGESYGMVAYGGASKEWFEQADAFEALCKGKTLDEVKALAADGGKGSDEVISAGCTIAVSDFVLAIEKAVNNASASKATAEHTLKLGIVSTQSGSDANEDKMGYTQLDVSFAAASTDKDGKITAIVSDAIQVKTSFDTKGVTTSDKSAKISTKRDDGANYGMVAYGGAAKEWFEQANAFDAACLGKSAGEVAGLENDKGYGIESLQSAGCTIAVSDMVKAAAKAAQ